MSNITKCWCMYRLKTENAGYKPDVDIFNRLEIFLGRFSNKILSILKSFSGDFSRFFRSNYLFKVYNLYISRDIYENENLLKYILIIVKTACSVKLGHLVKKYIEKLESNVFKV